MSGLREAIWSAIIGPLIPGATTSVRSRSVSGLFLKSRMAFSPVSALRMR